MDIFGIVEMRLKIRRLLVRDENPLEEGSENSYDIVGKCRRKGLLLRINMWGKYSWFIRPPMVNLICPPTVGTKL